MKLGHLTRATAAALMLGGMGLATTVRAQDDGSGIDNELGVGLYLGNCDNLVAGAALYDLGDAELESENFSNTDENSDASTPDTTLEDQVDEDSSGDETDPTGGGGDNSDTSVVVQGDQPAVWVSQDASFDGSLVDLVDAPFAVAVRFSAQDDVAGSNDGDDFIACGEFGGAVAGDEIVIPMVENNNSGYAGIVILTAGDDDSTSTASTYLYNREMGASNADDATPTS